MCAIRSRVYTVDGGAGLTNMHAYKRQPMIRIPGDLPGNGRSYLWMHGIIGRIAMRLNVLYCLQVALATQ